MSADMPRPTAVVTPMTTDKDNRGLTGLDNIGNTCFINSIIQALVNTSAVRDYFISDALQKDINTENPLGSGGGLALNFAALTRKMWQGTDQSINPSALKRLVAKKASQFSGFAQHDAQEFLAFLLDGLHEDLNRVINKPYIENTCLDHLSKEEAAAEAWRRYKLRNDSFVVDNFQGQYRSELLCPKCEKVSVTFDPYMYVSVPIPKETVEISVIVFREFRESRETAPLKVKVSVPRQCTLRDISDELNTITKIPPHKMKFMEITDSAQHKGRLMLEHKNFYVDKKTAIFGFEVDEDCDEDNDELVHICCTQRSLKPTPQQYPMKCSHCDKTSEELSMKMKRCAKCLRLGYCSAECQKAHWRYHKGNCKPLPLPLGKPFIVSIPKSKLTYHNLVEKMQRRAHLSVNVFQTPLEKSTSIDSMAGGDATSRGVDDSAHTSQFYIKPVDSYGLGLRDTESGARLQDLGDQVLDIKTKCLAVDWKNDDKLPHYVMVDNKEMEVEEDESCAKDFTDKDGPISLHKCLQLFTKPEILSPEEAWFCPTCKTHREAEKQMSLWTLPDVLIIQLKRFSFRNHVWRDKIDEMITYPISGLDMSSFYTGPPTEHSLIYDLYGVTNHHGGLMGGHYTAFARCLNADNSTQYEWRLMNDSRVTYMPSDRHYQVVNQAAYVLFYQRRKPFLMSPRQSGFSTRIPHANTMETSDDNRALNINQNQNHEEIVNKFDDEINNDDVLEHENAENKPMQGDENITYTKEKMNMESRPLIEEIHNNEDESEINIGDNTYHSKGRDGRSQSSSDYEIIDSDPESSDSIVFENGPQANDGGQSLGYTDMDEMD